MAGNRHPPRPHPLTAGVDNLLDATYAEHISRSGAAVAGCLDTTRVNEPGLNLWVISIPPWF